MKTEDYHRYGFPMFLLVLFVITIVMIRPYISAILASFFLAYFSFPIYKYINRYIKSRNLSAFIVCFLIIAVILLPLLFLLNSLINDLPGAYLRIIGKMSGTQDSMNQFSLQIYQKFGIQINLHDMVQQVASFLLGALREVLTSVPARLIQFFIVFFLVFFMLKDGRELSEKIIQYLPLNEKTKVIVVKRVKEVTNAIVFGHVVTALIQAILGWFGFKVFGIGSAELWALLMFFFAIIPMAGPPIVYVPISVIAFASAMAAHDSIGMIKAVILLLFGIAVISTVDNIIKPKIIGDQVKIHPAIIFIGVIGGLSVFGIIGIIIGPLVISILFTLLQVYETTVLNH